MNSKRNMVLIGAVVAALLAFLVYQRWLQGQGLEEGLIQANGRIEGTPVTIASKYPGRVLQLPFKEGDEITAGQVVARISDEEVQAKLKQAQAQWERFGILLLGTPAFVVNGRYIVSPGFQQQVTDRTAKLTETLKVIDYLVAKERKSPAN